jgi:hypothetical protein
MFRKLLCVECFTNAYLKSYVQIGMRFFLINQSNYGIKPTYLSVSMIVSPIFQLELQPVFSFLLSLTLNRITHQLTILTTMSSSKPKKTPDLPSSPVATKQSDSYALPVTPSPTKDCGNKRPSIDNGPLFHDWKTLRTTPPTKVTDDPFIDERKLSGTLLVRIGDTKTHDKTLIPVTMKMIHSTVNESNHFFWKDGRQLHLVKVVGALLHFH